MDAALQLISKDTRVQLLKTAISWKEGGAEAKGLEQVEATEAAKVASTGVRTCTKERCLHLACFEQFFFLVMPD